MDPSRYKRLFLDYLNQEVVPGDPKNLYEPIEYIMQLGGKRLRPMLVLMSCELFGGKAEQALDAALAVEMFHNFTLIHDDIMDKADLRRGSETVHRKWDLNTGILSGDALMILSYQRLESYRDEVFSNLAGLFSRTALEICEGQQMDIDFESMEEVVMERYFRMIRYKTAVLLACALEMGAIIAGASMADRKGIYAFGSELGLAFQLQDDFLDTFGGEDFGKEIGGDIRENKKTYLYIKTMELADQRDREELKALYNKVGNVPGKLSRVKQLFVKYGVPALLQQAIEDHTRMALDALGGLTLSPGHKKALEEFGQGLMNRKL